MRGNSHVRFGAGDEETCLGDGARRFIPNLPKPEGPSHIAGLSPPHFALAFVKWITALHSQSAPVIADSEHIELWNFAMALSHPGVDPYARAGVESFQYFNEVAFEEAHSRLLPFLPAPPFSALDVGAGSGRDARALSARGANVTAVEPWDGMRKLASSKPHSGPPIMWLADELPYLSNLRQMGLRFDLVLLSAVIMHLRSEERQNAISAVSNLTMPDGIIYITFRQPVDHKRYMFPASAEDIKAAAHAADLSLLSSTQSAADPLKRLDVTWDIFIFQK